MKGAAMTAAIQESQTVLEVVKKAVAHHGATREALIPILSEVNRGLGYLPKEALEAVGRALHTSRSQVASVATFYSMLNTEPRGRHVIQFCENAPCHVAGGREVWKALLEELKLAPGETSADGRWTLITTSCLGICSVGPVVVIDDDVHGNVGPKQVCDLLARYE
jgi:NADH-quinone oxidoreductase subunit E